MKAIRYAIVPGDTEQEAIEQAHNAFSNLCEGDREPRSNNRLAVYERYHLVTEAPIDETGIWQTASPEAADRLEAIWEDMINELRDIHEGDDTTYSPGTHNRTRKYRIYDQHGGAVVCGHRMTDLMESDDHWLVAAQCS
jgi:hypothetical protein